MWRMLQQEHPDGYVLETGETHSVHELCDRALGRVGLDYQDVAEIDPRYFRTSVRPRWTCCWAIHPKAKLGWSPQVTFEGLVDMMVDADLELAEREQTLVNAGNTVSLPWD